MKSLLLIIIVVFLLFLWQKRGKVLNALPKVAHSYHWAFLLLFVIILFLVFMGKAHWLMGVLGFMIALFGRMLVLTQYWDVVKKILGKKRDAKHSEDGFEYRRSHTRSASSMSAEQAAEILGISIDANAEKIKKAHKSLMQKVHPDRGGSEHLAKQVNQAKEVLLQNK